MSAVPASIASELQKLEPSTEIVMFEVDAAIVAGGLYRFHAGLNQLLGNLIWQGNTYSAFPIEADGFEWNGKGQLPRPRLRVSNLYGAITALVLAHNDLAGVKVSRIRTLAKYLDAANFPGGVNPQADPTAEYPRDVYFIDRKAGETFDAIEFELACAHDLAGVMLPRRQIIQNYCPWRYRGPECGYAGSSWFDINDAPAVTAGQDVCGKRLASCAARFGQYAELPYGGFPAAGLLRA